MRLGRELACLLLLCLPLGGSNQQPVSRQRFPNILLVTIDTLRADHVSCYGYSLKTTPVLDQLAAEGVRFAHAYTTIPQTGPAHISLFTSTYPHQHGARINGVSYNKEARLLFLPQLLKRYGYRSAAFVSAWPLVKRLTDLDRWFDHWDEDLNRRYQLFNSQRWAEDVTPKAIEWLKGNHHRPFFLWIHYFDPHEPYELREAFANLPQLRPRPQLNGYGRLDEETRERIRAYDSEVAYTDHHLGRLLRTVDELGLRQSTLVIAIADHGESLGEHDYVGHGRHLYQNIVEVPWIMRLPGVVPAGSVVEQPVTILDVMPTVLHLAIERAGGELQIPFPLEGRNLAPAIIGQQPLEEKTVYCLTYAGKKGFLPSWFARLWVDEDTLPLRLGYVMGRRKAIWTPTENRLEIYDLSRDPYELSPATPDRATAQYRAEQLRLERWYKATAQKAGELKLTEKDVEILKSLGYLR